MQSLQKQHLQPNEVCPVGPISSLLLLSCPEGLITNFQMRDNIQNIRDFALKIQSPIIMTIFILTMIRCYFWEKLLKYLQCRAVNISLSPLLVVNLPRVKSLWQCLFVLVPLSAARFLKKLEQSVLVKNLKKGLFVLLLLSQWSISSLVKPFHLGRVREISLQIGVLAKPPPRMVGPLDW